MNSNPYESPDTKDEMPVQGMGMRWPVKLLTAVAVIGLVIALLLPAVRHAPESARRMSCQNNLKHIGLALRNYEDVYHALPPAVTVDAEGKPLHSWRTLILPFLEQQALYEKIDLSKPWNDPANKEVCETMLSVYRCPSSDYPPSHTTYLAVVAAGGCFRPTEPRKLTEISDDHAQTLMVVEVDSERHIPWMSPIDASDQWLLGLSRLDDPPHPGGTQAVFVAGNVSFLSSSIETETMRALISINGDDSEATQESD